MLSVRSALALCCMLVFATTAQAQNKAAEDIVRKMAMVQSRIAPKFDFNRITQLAMGRNWPKASSTEQRQVVAEFSRLLIRTYSNALANLRDLDVNVRDSRDNGGGDVTVRTQMVGTSKPKPVEIDYSLAGGSGSWRVFDVSVEGVSLVTAYRDEFNGLVSSSGVAGLIDALKQKNQK
jgi:phospholipid transport system substrate-binding protein